jgi:hypothetical protein
MLKPLLEHLHQHECQRDTTGNRTLHYDQYCMLVLLYVLNPTASSLRAISQASELAKVRDELGNEEASLGSLSEAGGLFSADLVKPIIGPCLLKSRMLPRTRDGAAFSKRSPPWMALLSTHCRATNRRRWDRCERRRDNVCILEWPIVTRSG